MIQHLSSRQMSVGTAHESIAEGYVAGTELHLYASGNNSKDIFLGADGVTITTGYLLRKDTAITIRLMERQTLYAVAETNGQLLTILEVGGI